MIRRTRHGRGRHAAPRPAADDIGGALWVLLHVPAALGLWWAGAHPAEPTEHRPPPAAASAPDAASEDDAAEN